MSGDLADRVAGLAAAIEARVDEDELVAQDAALSQAVLGIGRQYAPDWFTRAPGDLEPDDDEDGPRCVLCAAGVVVYDEGSPTAEQAEHIARHDPARTLRRVKATRDLVAVILGEQHYSADVGYYSCSQAQEGAGLTGGPTGPPGSGCSDPERAGKPCDCGRDQRVARMLEIIASEWEG